MTDYYLQDRSRLQGQPKRTIADYVESQGILVPRRFDSLQEARASGLPILVRSEHEQEYDGVSGLLNSFGLEIVEDSLEESAISQKVIAFDREPIYPNIYCTLMGLELSSFQKEVGFSLWEWLGGYNRAIIADSAILDRYHILTKASQEERNFFNYALVEDGRITQSMFWPYTPMLKETLLDLLALYEKVRQLEHFDPHHCPLLEVQTIQGKNYFLQYHRTRDFAPAEFALARPPGKGEIEAFFVRGATSPEGKAYQATFTYAAWEQSNDGVNSLWQLHPTEEASFDPHYNIIFSELMVRQRKLQIVEGSGLEILLRKAIEPHYYRSKLFGSSPILGNPP